MTDKRRYIERTVDGLANEQSDGEQHGPAIVYETEGNEYVDENGESVSLDECGNPIPPQSGVLVVLDARYASQNIAWGSE